MGNVELSREILDTLEQYDFSVLGIEEEKNKCIAELECFTPLGEDWLLIICFDGTDDGFTEAISERYDNFDVDEETSILIEHRGENGIPSSVKALLEDAEWKKKTLEDLANDLMTLELFGE